MELYIIAFVFGLLIGIIFQRFMFRRHKIGDLRIDKSDPNDNPYMFMELNVNTNALKSLNYVVMNVKEENFIS